MNVGCPNGLLYVIEYPFDLSILLKGGEETNKDSLSSGEWKKRSSNGNRCSFQDDELWDWWEIDEESCEVIYIEGEIPVIDLSIGK